MYRLGEHASQTPGMPQPGNAMAGGMNGQGEMKKQIDGLNELNLAQNPSDKYRKIYEQAQAGSYSKPAVVDAPRDVAQPKPTAWDQFKTQLAPKQGDFDDRGFWERGWDQFTDELGVTQEAEKYKITKLDKAAAEEAAKPETKKQWDLDKLQKIFTG